MKKAPEPYSKTELLSWLKFILLILVFFATFWVISSVNP